MTDQPTTAIERPFQIGDTVRVLRIPPHIGRDYPYPVVRLAFEAAIGKVYTVESIDWDGWVWLWLGEEHGGIGVQPDCVALVRATEGP